MCWSVLHCTSRTKREILLFVWISSSRHHETSHVLMKCSSLVISNRAYVVMYVSMCVCVCVCVCVLILGGCFLWNFHGHLL